MYCFKETMFTQTHKLLFSYIFVQIHCKLYKYVLTFYSLWILISNVREFLIPGNQDDGDSYTFISFRIKTINIDLSTELRIRWLYPLQRGKTPPKVGSLLSMTLHYIWLWDSSSGDLGMWSNPSLPLLSGPLWIGVVLLVRVQSMDEIDLFINSS